MKFTLGVSAWEAEIRIGSADASQRCFRVGTVLGRASDGRSEPVTVTVARLERPTNSRVVPPNGEAVLRPSAALLEPGVFTASLYVSTFATVDGRETERVERQISIEVTCEMEAFLVTPKALALDHPEISGGSLS